MKAIIFVFALIAMMMVFGCSDKTEKLTEVPINELNVPQNFDYQMSRTIELNLQGIHKAPLTITSMEGKVLYKGMMNPETGIETKINLASVNRKVRVVYHVYDLELNVTGNNLSHTFTAN
ncbi:MAG: hypothetical protein PHO32_01280 [Candidatus Cloacimonetes bacterium]|nr:hypothetical protein [Candidatus Cloacimonadota bacterium]